MFNNIQTAADVQQEKDVLGGSRVVDTDVYDATIKLAYAGKSKGGALSLTIHADLDGTELRHTFWVTNKQGQNYYEKDGKKHFLPGWNAANGICLLITNQELTALPTEQKVVKLWDFEAKAEVNTPVEALVALHGGKVKLAVQKQLVDVNQETAPGSGVYVPSGKTREQNEIDKVFFYDDGRTVKEIRENQPAEFMDKWIAQNKGKVFDRTDKKAAAAGGLPGAAAGGKPANSLFGNK